MEEGYNEAIKSVPIRERAAWIGRWRRGKYVNRTTEKMDSDCQYHRSNSCILSYLIFKTAGDRYSGSAEEYGAVCLCADYVDCQTNSDLPDFYYFDFTASLDWSSRRSGNCIWGAWV